MTKSVLPVSVRVGPFEYSVVVSDERVKVFGLREGATESSYGAFSDHQALEIVLRASGENVGSRRDTLLHELIHAVFSASGFSGRDKKRPITDEDIIRHLTPGLLAVLRDNPDLVRYLIGQATGGIS